MLDFEYSKYESLVDSKDINVDIQLEAWNYVLGINVKLDERFCNPKRLDRTPGCKLNNVNGVVLMSDYGDDYWNRKSIFSVVMDIYAVDYKTALQKIYYEMISNSSRRNNTTSYTNTYQPKFEFKIAVENRGWQKFDRQFFGYANITRQQLEFENCYPISKYWTNSKYQPKIFNGYQCTRRDPGYSYSIDNNIKMKFPKRDKKEGKWIANIKKHQIGGNIVIVNNPGELRTIIITKSLNDYLAIYNASGFNCRYLPNEAVYLSKEFIDWLNDNFDLIIFLMDNDARGLAATNRIKSQWKNQIKDKPVFATSLPIHYLIEGITDPFDLAKHQSYNIDVLSQELELIYEQALENLYEFENNLNI